MRDLHDRYLRGIGDLLQVVEPAEDDHLTVLTLQGRLAGAISDIRRFGPTDNANAEIARVTMELDRISLQRLHQSFRSLCGIPEAPPAEPRILHNLPPRPFFVGRQREIRLLHEYLSPTERVALISVDGIGGIGKTTLAREIAHQLVEERAFDAVIWATAKRRILLASGIADGQPDFTSLDELLEIIVAVLGKPSLEAGSAAVRQGLSESRCLVVVDNFETIQDKRVFEFLRNMRGSSKALVTNRYRPAAQIRGGELVLPLEGLRREDAFVLLRNAGRTIPRPLSNVDDSLLETICERTHGNPLAMEWFVAQVERGQQIHRVLQRLGRPKANDLYAFIFEDSYTTLSADAQKTLWALAAIDMPTVENQICYVAGLSPGEFERAMDELIGTSLVAFDGQAGRYSIHGLTREYVLALMGEAPASWAQRAVEWENKIRYESLDETAKAAVHLLSKTDKPTPIPTLIRSLGDMSADLLSKLITSLQEAGLALYDEALQMLTLEPRVREAWRAQLAGSGQGARGDGTVVTAGGALIAGDVVVGGDVVGRDQHVVVIPQLSVERYLNYLVESRNRLRMLGINPSVMEISPIRLSEIFIPLYTTQRRSSKKSERPVARALDREEEGDTRVSVLDAVTSSRRAVILGEPGSGKTTLLNYLVWMSASRRLGLEMGSSLRELDELPLPVLARNYAALLSKGSDIPFVEFLSRNLASLGFSDLIEYFGEQLAAGKCLILIDGLDEVADEQLRRQVVSRIEDFLLQYPQNRVVVTSRIASLRGVPLFPAEWAAFEIAALTDEQVDRFIAAWYGSLAETLQTRTENTERLARNLFHAVHRNRQFRSLATNPLLLTVILVIHANRGELPESRAALYQDVSDLLVERWERAKVGGPPTEELDAVRVSDLQAALAEVAFRIQASREALVDEAALVGALAPYLNSDWRKTAHLITYVRERAGLLVEQAAGKYSFAHLILQEFYAARYLASQERYPETGIELLRADFDLWREVYLLSVLNLEHLGQTARAIEAIRALCPQEHWKSEIDLRLATVAGQAIAEIGIHRVERTEPGKGLAQSVRARLVELLESGMLSAAERAFAGDTLTEIGDPRFAFTLAGDLLVPDIGWCEVPAGPFLMGSSKVRDADAFDDEMPQHQVMLPAYRVGRYPVINAQYRYFVESDGYSEPLYWTEQGWAWRQDQRVEAPCLWDDPTWNKLNHPVVGVSWHEAIAFARWLTMHLRKTGLLPEQMIVRLLTEAEWEKVARGSDGRIHPWGDAWDSERANTRESNLGQTTAVGGYPAGASPYGCLDMSGNVWEWTLSLWGRENSRADFRYPYCTDNGREDMVEEGMRIIRGGSWASPRIHARAAFRGMADPRTQNSMIGFRVALAQSSQSCKSWGG